MLEETLDTRNEATQKCEGTETPAKRARANVDIEPITQHATRDAS